MKDDLEAGARPPCNLRFGPALNSHVCVPTSARAACVVALLAAALAPWLVPSPSVAQPVPLGAEFPIAASLVGGQRAPDLAPTLGGGFQVVWHSVVTPGDDSKGLAIVGRRLDSNGVPVSGDFQVNTSTTYDQKDARVSSRPDGSFIVTWRTSVLANKGIVDAVQGRAFDSNGQAEGPDFEVAAAPNIYTCIQSHDVAAATSGDFVVAVSEYYLSFGPYSWTIRKLRRQGDGSPIDSATFDSSDSNQLTVRVASDDEAFVVIWQGRDLGKGFSTVAAQKLDAAGLATGPRVEPHGSNAFTGGSSADVALLSSGGFAVTWEGFDLAEGLPNRVFQRSVDAEGEPSPAGWIGLETSIEGEPSNTRLARGGDGSLMAVWESAGVSGEQETGIRGRLLAEDGSPLAAEFAVNTIITGDQSRPEIASSRDGKTFLVIWQSNERIYGRRFLVGGIFTDGFESGDSSRWSTSSP